MSVIILVLIIIFLYIFTKETFSCPCKKSTNTCEANNTCEACEDDTACTQYNTATHVFGMGWKF